MKPEDSGVNRPDIEQAMHFHPQGETREVPQPNLNPQNTSGILCKRKDSCLDVNAEDDPLGMD